MSLRDIREVRLDGLKPGVVLVVIGDVPRSADDVGMVVVRPGVDDPRLMDWRPMVGLTAAIFTLAPRPDLLIAVMDALLAVGVKLFGAVDYTGGIHPLLENADASHESLLRRAWEVLCQY